MQQIVLGPFEVSGTGALSVKPGSQAQVAFAWRGRQIALAFNPCEDAIGVGATLGRVPSSARNPAGRPSVLALAATLAPALPPGWRVNLLADHSLQLVLRRALTWPTTAVALVTTLVSILLTLAPYLDLLDEAGVDVGLDAGSAALGMANA